MKTQSLPKFLLTTATIAALAGHQVLAQNQVAVPNPGVAAFDKTAVAVPADVADGIGRSGAGAAQQDQIGDMLDKSTPKSGGQAGNLPQPELDKGDKPIFEFNPRKVKEEYGKLTDDQKKYIDRLGCELVEFDDPEIKGKRISRGIAQIEENLIKVRKPEEMKARNNYNKARDERIKAGSNLAVLENRRQALANKIKEAGKAQDLAQKELDEINGRIDHAEDWIIDLGRQIEEQQKVLGIAERDRVRAVSAHDAAKKEEDKAKAAKAVAEKKLQEAIAAHVAASNALVKAVETVKKAKESVESDKGAVINAEKKLAEAKDAEDEAARNLAKAQTGLHKAEADLVKGRKTLESSEAAAKKALEKLENRKTKAAEALKAFEKKLTETKEKVKQPRGWFTRHLVPGWFLPSVARDEDRVKARKEAVDKVDQEIGTTKEATAKKIAANRENLKKLEGAVGNAKAVVDNCNKDLQGKKSARDNAEGVLKGAQDGLAKSKGALRDAEGKRDEADKAKVSAARAEERAKQEDAKAKTVLEDAGKAVEEAAGKVEESKKKLDAEENKLEELKQAKTPADQAAILLKEPREKAEKQLEAAKVNVGRLEEELGKLEENGEEVNRAKEQYDAAVKTEEQWKPAWETARRLLDNARSDAAKEVARIESEKRDELRKKADSIWEGIEKDLTGAETAEAGHGVENTGKELEKAEKEQAAAAEAVKQAETKRDQLVSEEGQARDKLKNAAEGDRAAADEAVKAAQKKVSEQKRALQELKNKAKDADRVVLEKRRLHEKNTSFMNDATSRAAKMAKKLRDEFDRQVENAIKHRPDPGDDPSDVDWKNAIQVRNAYRKMKVLRDLRHKEYVAARKALADLVDKSERKIPWKDDPNIAKAVAQYEAARDNYRKVRENEKLGDKEVKGFDDVEDTYNTFFSDATCRTDTSLSDEKADACHETAEKIRDFYGYRVRGDRRWLARTSVNGENLLDLLAEEFAWEAEKCVADPDIKAKRDDYDPLLVVLDDGQKQACAENAAYALKRRAVYGGFYFCGADANGKEKTIWVDKGRYGPATVNFGKFDKESGFVAEGDGEEGRIYDKDDIVAKFVPHSASTNALEGEAFNFIEFRKNFNALNANPDIKRADVQFEPLSTGFDYGYDAEDGELAIAGFRQTNRSVRAVMNVQEERWPAPVHGVLSIDNFNSMGDPDQIAGNEDTWMARLLLQRRLFSDEDALSIQGNTSLGGSLYGGAASYYAPRDNESRFWRRGEWFDSLSLTLHGGYTDVNQQDVIEGLDVLGTGYYAGILLSTRVAETDGGTWDVSAGFTYRSVESSVEIANERFDLGPNGGDPYTLMPLSLALMYADKDVDSARGRNFFTLEGVYNLGGSSADELAAFRPAIDDDKYLLARLQFARLQLINESAESSWLPRMAFFRVDGQWAFTPVIGAEQYGLGGHSTVRGYVEREFMGDSGASATLELRTPILLNPAWLESRKENPYKSDEQMQLVLFVDFGWYNLQDADNDGDDDNTLLGAGLGLRYSIDDLRVLGRAINPVLRLDWGFPVWQQENLSGEAKSSAGVFHASVQFPF